MREVYHLDQYIDLNYLKDDCHVVQKQDGEYICSPCGGLMKITRTENSSIVCVMARPWDIDSFMKGWNWFDSPSGRFICDEKGRLRAFLQSQFSSIDPADMQNFCQVLSVLDTHIYRNLIIPEGVRQIGHVGMNPSDDERSVIGFKTIVVLDEIKFPDSLKTIGYRCFSDSCLPEVVFPASVEKLDGCAFANSRIGKLTIPPNMKKVTVDYQGVINPTRHPMDDELWIVGRNFKAALIHELICPEGFSKLPLMPEAGIEQIKRAAKKIL